MSDNQISGSVPPNTETLPNLYESDKFRVEFRQTGQEIYLRPVGIIDEDCKLNSVVTAIMAIKPLPLAAKIDLGSVIRINSCGVREWLLFMSKVQRILTVSFLNVSELFMEQAAVIKGTFGGPDADVLSFFLPYHCGTCKTRRFILAEKKSVDIEAGTAGLPQHHCEACKGKLEFDGMVEQYFGYFLNN